MILHVAATAPWALREIADAALAFHIGGAFAGLGAGTVALIARKGQRLHRLAGNVFLFAMLAMSVVGAVVAPMIGDVGSAFAGAITAYLVVTGWRAGRAGEVKGGRFEMAGVALLGVAVVAVLMLGGQALASPARELAGVPAFAFFVMATMAALIGALDLKLILGPVLTRPRKLARHIWRMGLGLWIALMSGLAQPKVGGVIFHGHAALQWIPVAALVATIVYWLVKVRRPAHRPARPSRPALTTSAQGVFQ
ncbi:hypothetical protein [Phenylobacterium sp.]|uniref:hypothetical protein n=1 Tax=Phenylobacterium sp. TaxID=1871053 RepID=UPI001223D487|nr:hypothetical protein [Phenylobacterium sp.]THD61783.1 MAG: hypothetical protein E8A49_09390 [Phenylobacterium sp.]